jgi:hypothetical protein
MKCERMSYRGHLQRAEAGAGAIAGAVSAVTASSASAPADTDETLINVRRLMDWTDIATRWTNNEGAEDRDFAIADEHAGIGGIKALFCDVPGSGGQAELFDIGAAIPPATLLLLIGSG